MCGRFGLYAELDALAELFNFDPSIMRDIYSPRWNIPPTTPVLSVHHTSQASAPVENTARLLRWGMTSAGSSRAASAGRPLFNARAETVHRLPSFRHAFSERRCLIPANGFYEWKRDEAGNRTPVWFHRKDDAPIAFAGIWTSERTPDGDIASCAIITCAANNLVAPIHHRMPVILPQDTYREWLNPHADVETLLAFIQPLEWHNVAHHTVSSDVNRAANDYPSLIEHAPSPMQFSLPDIHDPKSPPPL